MEIRVVADHMHPALHEIGALLAIESEGIAVDTAGPRLVVDRRGLRRPDIGPTALGNTQTEIDIIEIDRKVLGVETTDRLEFRALDRDAGACHRANLAGHRELVEIAATVLREAAIDVPYFVLNGYTANWAANHYEKANNYCLFG